MKELSATEWMDMLARQQAAITQWPWPGDYDANDETLQKLRTLSAPRKCQFGMAGISSLQQTNTQFG